jgi:hypothetical protein
VLLVLPIKLEPSSPVARKVNRTCPIRRTRFNRSAATPSRERRVVGRIRWYGDDEGEREEILEGREDEETEPAG